jgi:hypothetical protein
VKREIRGSRVRREKEVTLDYKENRGLQEFVVRRVKLVLRVTLAWKVKREILDLKVREEKED